ncbi:MAG: transglutaminase domain-containing protein [Lachnospiraceae bacterium]|nr:transglutaminase domain-containing protein [Lachnospiraceae bacterium]
MRHTLLHFNQNTLWRLTNLVFLTCIGLFGGGNFLGIGSLKPVHILAALAAVFILILLSSMTWRNRLLGFTGIILVVFGAGAAAGIQNCFSFVKSYSHWLTGSPAWDPGQLTGYEIIQVIFLTLLCYLLLFIMEKDFRIKMAVLLLLLSALLYCLFTEKELSKICVALLLCYVAVIYTEWTQTRWKKEKAKDHSAYMLWIMPFLAAYFLLMLIPSVPETPYDWPLFKNVYQQLKESFLKLSYNLPGTGGEDYDLSLSGFSPESELGGNSLETEREIMTIQSQTKLSTNVYLTGKVYDTFNGRGWEQQNQDTSKEPYMDTIQTLYAVRRYDKEYQTDYLSQAKITIQYRYFRSEYLFAPLKAFSFRQNSSHLNFRESGGSLFFDRRKGYGTNYEVSFYQLNAGQENFHQFINAAGFLADDENELHSILNNLNNQTKESITVNDMQRYRQAVYDNYLEDITLSAETTQYLQEITKDARTDADKLRAIERELSAFTYTLTPGQLPETVTDSAEFLDYFLLESKEGYCNYFATAFTLLARAQGIPARFVQGFCVPAKDSLEVKVYSGMAHAWPEVYLEDIGWIPFEPTPGYSQTRYASWAVRNSSTELSADLDGQTPEEEWAEERIRNKPKQEMGGMQESVIHSEKNNFGRLLRIISRMLLSVLGTAILLVLLSLLLTRYKYKKMSPETKFRAAVSRNLKILSFMGIKREDVQTLSEFKEQAQLFIGEQEPLQFLNCYEDFLYGNKKITQHTLAEVQSQQRGLLLILKQRKRRAYFYYRILMAIQTS